MRNADHQRFEHLLSEHAGIVRKIAAMYAAVSEDRRDLEQDIGVQAWRSFRRYDEARAKFSTWLYRVALNVAISQLRRSHRAGAGCLEPLADVHLETVASDGTAHDEALQRNERVAALHAFIHGLDAFNRALMVLYLEDRSYAEIAEVLGISETNVATKLNRIKQKLRAKMTVVDTEGVRNGTR